MKALFITDNNGITSAQIKHKKTTEILTSIDLTEGLYSINYDSQHNDYHYDPIETIYPPEYWLMLQAKRIRKKAVKIINIGNNFIVSDRFKGKTTYMYFDQHGIPYIIGTYSDYSIYSAL